jgi:DNA-directed RNA polymerase specialized sigma24 family protein
MKQFCAGCGEVHDVSDMQLMSDPDDIARLHGQFDAAAEGRAWVAGAEDLELLRTLAIIAESRAQLLDDERLVVEQLRKMGVSFGKIAQRLDESRSTVYRRYSYLGDDA